MTRSNEEQGGVRLWRWRDGDYHRSGATPDPTHIAYPAAQAEAMGAVVEAARWVLDWDGGDMVWGAARDVVALKDALRALLATPSGEEVKP